MIRLPFSQPFRVQNSHEAIVAALLAATLFRALPLMQNRFHPDEALYATFARYAASGHGSLLAYLVVDKPPLSFYLNGLSVLIWGGNEFAVRLPNLYASIVSVALLFALARRLYDLAAAYLAAWIFALSPFAILFSITAFIDPLLTMLLLWGLWMSCARRHRLTGLVFALAFATKQTTLVFVPLALAFTLLRLPGEATIRQALQRLGQVTAPMLAGLALTTLAVLIWDAVRHAPINVWEQGYSDNFPGRFVRANEIWSRARAWLDWLQYFTASKPLNLIFLVGLPLLLTAGLLRPSRAALADLILTGYLLLYLAGYWLLAFNIWDRYLLPILPLFALLLARITWHIAYRLSPIAYRLSHSASRVPLISPCSTLHPPRSTPHAPRSTLYTLRTSNLTSLAFCLLLLPSAFTAARSGYPIGGDHGAYDGIDQVADFIHTLPPKSVLYDHWLGWEFNFYLFDRPLYISWFPTPDALRTDLKAFGKTSPRYLVMPSWESDTEVREAAAQADFEFVPVYTTTRRDGTISFVVYQLVLR